MLVVKINSNSYFLLGYPTATKISLFQGKMKIIFFNSKFKATINCTINIHYAIATSYFFLYFWLWKFKVTLLLKLSFKVGVGILNKATNSTMAG